MCPDPSAVQFCIEIQRDVRIPTGVPGLTLSADVYRPRVDEPVPALVTVLPYRKDFVAGGTYDEPARWFAARGYASLVVDLLGTGDSDGIRRPEFDPGDGDDGIASVEWAAAQPWCDGSVGMWGLSYAANVALRTASRRPAALRAIVAVAHGLDPGRDSVHPDGARGDLHALANRGSSLLLQQLLPPLVDSTPAGQRRWQRRMREAEPAFLDYARHGPRDPIWHERAIDGAAIEIPALCVGGWRDAFPDGLVDAYEQVAGPKKLLMGPWGHLLPHRSAYRPVDFLAIALRWWDHWLRGVPTGVMDEPAVTLFRPGPAPQWLGYETWPPPATDLGLATAGDTTLGSIAPAPNGHVIARHPPDATVGALRGLPGLGMGEDFPTGDQRDDDRRSVTVTSAPLPAGIVVGGRPEVSVRLRRGVGRLVVRLTDVHADGRSMLVTTGVLCPGPGADRLTVRLRPIVAPVAAGHRLRVAVSDADFPRLTPLVSPVPLEVRSVEVSVPVLRDGAPVQLPAIPAVPPEPGNDLRVSRDPVSDEVEVVVTGLVPEQVSPAGHRYRLSTELHARVGPAAPEAAEAGGSQVGEVRLAGGEVVRASVTVRCTQTAVRARAEVRTNGSVVFSRTWETVLVPECPVFGGASDRHAALPAMRGRFPPPALAPASIEHTPGAAPTMTDDLPLSEHVVLETSDLAEVNRHMRRELPARRLAFATDRRRLAARLHAVPLPSVTPMYVAYGGDVVDVLAEDGPYYFVHVPLTGRVVITDDRREFTTAWGSAAVASPTESLELRWHPDATAMVFRIDRRALEGALVDLMRLPVEEPLRFENRMDLTRQPGASWAHAAMFLADELNQSGGLLSHRTVVTDLQRMIMRGLLLSQPHTYTAVLAHESAAATLPPHIAAAVAVIDAGPERPLTAEALAREVNVSPRLLQAGFREHLGVSPMQYLRNERLRRVHEDLTSGDPARRPTIAEVAYRWGFTHLGRFAGDYRARYGEPPSTTLRRH